jgi:hypothetical protein
MQRPKYLTKSRFKLATDCPTKLFYTNKEEYVNSRKEDEFLAALAEGGLQVGEYAKLVWPGGVSIDELSSDAAVIETNKYLKEENIIIYEPAFLYNDLLVRVDVLIKKGKNIKLIEVKAKSFRSVDEWFNKKGNKISSSWRSYLLDIAFQKYAVQNAMKGFEVSAYLGLCNKNHTTSLAGLYGNMVVKKRSNRAYVAIESHTLVDPKIMACENADQAVDMLWKEKYRIGLDEYSFEDYIQKLAASYKSDTKLTQPISTVCGDCEFITDAYPPKGKSGFHECWKSQTGLHDGDLNEPLVLQLWNYRGKQFQIEKGVYKLKDIDTADLLPIEPGDIGLTNKERQVLQIVQALARDRGVYFDKERIQLQLDKVEYPLHMIDFETTANALPLYTGTRPYEQIAFQFSHHIIEEDGSIRHANQWLNPNKDHFPNFEFVRELKKAVGDKGSIFRYATHENTILNAIHDQLSGSSEPDKQDLQDWIETITYRNQKETGKSWEGERNMIDLCQWVKWFYFDPSTNGSNSIKAILPSILNTSVFLQKKYAKPIYGADIPSLNLGPTTWIKQEDGLMVSPYKQLPKLSIEDIEQDDLEEYTERFIQKDELADGGSAMIAYNYMQFKGMSDTEKLELRQALLRYCELDTLAMVMLWEGFMDLIKVRK